MPMITGLLCGGDVRGWLQSVAAVLNKLGHGCVPVLTGSAKHIRYAVTVHTLVE